jgi:hypothetical protein
VSSDNLPHGPLAGGERLNQNWADAGAPSRATVWRNIRAFRYQGAGRAKKGTRKAVFTSALEQAEQLFDAADIVGYAARPILLFYGLSQAGRAIAAASTAADNNAYELAGHGIKVPTLGQRPPLHELMVVDDVGGGSFIQLANLLRSGTLPDGAPLGQLWAIIPDLPGPHLDTGTTSYLPWLRYRNVGVSERVITGRISELPPRLKSASTAKVAAFLAGYPTLAGYISLTSLGDTGVPPRTDDTLGVFCKWRVSENKDEQDYEIIEDRLTQPYRGDSERFVFPALGGASRPLHPLLAWWALLFALSMLARYEPESWTSCMDRNTSANAVPLEAALDRALHTCPELISHAIQAVSK